MWVECWKSVWNSWWSLECYYLERISRRMVSKECYISYQLQRKESMNNFDFVSIDEKEVPEKNSLIGTSDWFAKVNVFDVSCRSWLQTLNMWMISIYVGVLSTEIYPQLSNLKATSSFEVKYESVLFCEWMYNI